MHQKTAENKQYLKFGPFEHRTNLMAFGRFSGVGIFKEG
jgi:hypothetical protein